MQRCEFPRDGFLIVPDVVNHAECERLGLLTDSCHGSGSRRLLEREWSRSVAAAIRAHPAVAGIVPTSFVAVQCTYFEKSRRNNWLVAVHQDLSIPVKRHVAHPELSGWSEKEGVLYVQPPIEVLRNLIAIRLHIDACSAEDGPLNVVRGSHLHGRLSAEAASVLKTKLGVVACPAPRGAIMAMCPLLLHASSKATGISKRRVLHFLFGPPSLPHGLQWQDVA